ncbi:MAG TPA: histidine phosphatase family protein [Gammaproteobacteria bacterium]
MKRLTLFRHAKSSWRDPDLADHERPLSGRGEKDAPRMAERLRVRRARPSLIVTSTAKRALETAHIVARSLGYPREFLHVEPALYLADPATILQVIAAQDEGFSDLLLVAHNPGLTDLVNELVPDMRLNNLPTAGVVAMESTAERWADIGARNTTLIFYDYPKNPEVLVVTE